MLGSPLMQGWALVGKVISVILLLGLGLLCLGVTVCGLGFGVSGLRSLFTKYPAPELAALGLLCAAVGGTMLWLVAQRVYRLVRER
ncbi:MAG TPA: hypothetical protein VKT22_03515 [Steroidobacteraceae bacterium]|nr:hypothetical protein [Steroidobacteraceae bacterium]